MPAQRPRRLDPVPRRQRRQQQQPRGVRRIRPRDPASVFAALALALLAHWIVFALLRRVTRSSESALDDVVVEAVRKPLRWAAIAFSIAAAAENDALVGRGWDLLARFLAPAVIGWVAYAMARGLARGYEAQVGAASDTFSSRSRSQRE